MYMGPFRKHAVLIDTSGKKRLSSMASLHARASDAILYVTRANEEKISAADVYRTKDEMECTYGVPVVPVITCTDEACSVSERTREKLINFLHVSIREQKTVENLFNVLVKMEEAYEKGKNKKGIEDVKSKNPCF